MLEGIIALPTDLFYNTGISTYIWVLTNQKSKKRKGKIQLLNASDFSKPMRKSLGNKRKFINPAQIEDIEKLYKNFDKTSDKNSKIFDNRDFGFTKVTVERPKNLSEILDDEKENEKFEKFKDKEKIAKRLQEIEKKRKEFKSRKEFIKYLDVKLTPSQENLLISKDSESIPLKKDIKEYYYC